MSDPLWTLMGDRPWFSNPSTDGPTVGKPGEFPFTRGLHAEGYRARPWTIRQYSGFGTPEETNGRFKFLLEQGQTGLSLAFDLPTQMGYDPDHARSAGEVGRVGASICSIRDMERALEGIPLGKISLSMTINATAPILVAFFQVAGERSGVEPSKLMGTAQNDILKEFVARGTFIFPPRPSLRLATDLIVHSTRTLPKFNPISVSGYHMRDAGCSIEQEMGFALANATAYLDSVIARGLAIDDFAPRISWIFNSQSELFAEVAKYRALRRMWARLLRDRYGARSPKSWQMRVHVQTGGATLTAQQAENNIVRAAFQALASVLGGVQSLALSCYDEAVAIPTEKSQTLAVRTQQIIAHETGVTETVDPLGGSPYVEALTDELERRATEVLAFVERQGGAVAAVESGVIQSSIDEAAYRFQQDIESGKRVIVGLNRYTDKDKNFSGPMFRLAPKTERRARDAVAELRRSRDASRHAAALASLKEAAKQADAPLMPSILDAVRADATVGEIASVLRGIFGEHRQSARRLEPQG